MSRRYATVSFTGWVSPQTPDAPIYVGLTPNPGDVVAVIYPSAAGVTVEHLPEPVVFADGDVVRWRAVGEIGVRVDGEWKINHHSGWVDVRGASDDFIAECIRKETAYRLVREVTP